MNLSQLLETIAASPDLTRRITRWERIPARPARPSPWPEDMDPSLQAILRERGISALYSHQGEAWRWARMGRNVVVVTPTASGKTLCYNLPILQSLIEDPETRALYLFPTKALAQDQRADMQSWLDALGLPAKVHVYDGDTPPEERAAIRQAGQLVVTNPDMLHSGILPHHARWARLFRHLRFVVIDELHTYTGVFGSHVANVIRRLKRICAFYGASPIFICASATIANPHELAEALVEAPFEAVTESGAPQPERHVIFCNPPIVNERLGIRRNLLHEARDWAVRFLKNGVSTIVFARSRMNVELLLRYVRDALGQTAPGRAPDVHGYRGGYLPDQRRRIEADLREGRASGVIATNALELGVDIGSLEAAVLAGYPGSVSSTWQQWGRAGRRQGPSCAVLIASSGPLDQFIVTHPEFFLSQPPEAARVNPDNLHILVSHVKCAAFELPFRPGEPFGATPVDEILEFLAEEGVLRRTGGRYYWMAESFPASEVSLRSADQENVVIIDQTRGRRVIGEVDRASAPLVVHEQAIYLHEGKQYQVEYLDYKERKAYVREVDVDYYTDADLAVDLRVLRVMAGDEPTAPQGAAAAAPGRAWGEVAITQRATLFKKVRLHTHENVGWGKIALPEDTHHTTAYWVTFPHQAGWTPERLEGALSGAAYALRHLAPLYLLCSVSDLGAVPQVRSPFTGVPTVFLYDRVPGGVGLAEKLYASHRELLADAARRVAECPCADGCPSCIGADARECPGAKAGALELLRLGERSRAVLARHGRHAR
ncbi:MAG: DEAD/DEAH box helicase [Clostridia bacterium]|nr:DEAD/DEAH box helicase [Clostridia bacterium]